MSKRAAARFEAILAAEGMPAELPATPSWRRLPAVNAHHRRRVVVSLPSDRDGHQPTIGDRVANMLCDAQHVPGMVARLEDLYWRGNWRGFPPWHRQLIAAHVQDGTTVAEFSRARRRPYLQVWRVLEQHKRRAGIGGDDMGSERQQQATSRVEQTAAVRVKAVFSEKLDMHLGLGNIKYAEGELVMGGRFVKIEYPATKPHQHHDHVLVPVGPGVTIAVLKE